jgi:hypothetical protein
VLREKQGIGRNRACVAPRGGRRDDDACQLFAYDVVPAITESAHRSRIELGDAAFMIDGNNSVERRIENSRLARLTAPQLLLCPFAIVDIGVRPSPFEIFAGLVA